MSAPHFGTGRHVIIRHLIATGLALLPLLFAHGPAMASSGPVQAQEASALAQWILEQR